jgi:SAM-dependent methyltransferase
MRFDRLLGFYGRDHVRCPYCNSLPRQRFQAYLFSEGPLARVPNPSVLHFAPEFSLGVYLKRVKLLRYLKADYMVSFIPGICVRPDVITDLRNLDLPSNFFDIVICNHVLEHINEDDQALSELYRVISDRGVALLTVPISDSSDATVQDPSINTPELRNERYGSPDHVRLYGMDIVDKLRAAGFGVEVSRPGNVLSSEMIKEWVLDESEPHFILRKSHSQSSSDSR